MFFLKMSQENCLDYFPGFNFRLYSRNVIYSCTSKFSAKILDTVVFRFFPIMMTIELS